MRDAGCESDRQSSPDGHLPPEDHNLLLIEHTDVFLTPNWTLDHFAGSEMMLAASALGYDIIEKPIPKPEADWGSLWTMPVSVFFHQKQIERCSIARGSTYKNHRFKENSHQVEWFDCQTTLRAGNVLVNNRKICISQHRSISKILGIG